jgi:Peptidase M50B-like
MFSNIAAKILLVLFLSASPFLLYGFGKQLLQTISKFSIHSPQIQFFLVGIVIFFPIHYVAKRYFATIWNYLCVLEHECTHALVGLLFGKIPVGMRVSAWEGGEVQLRGGSNLWVSLAPYFLPTLSLILLPIAWVFSLFDSPFFYAILGFTIAFHIVTNWKETSFRQTDLQRAGILTSILVLPIANLLIYGAILSLVFGGAKGFAEFWVNGGKNSLVIVKAVFRLV